MSFLTTSSSLRFDLYVDFFLNFKDCLKQLELSSLEQSEFSRFIFPLTNGAIDRIIYTDGVYRHGNLVRRGKSNNMFSNNYSVLSFLRGKNGNNNRAYAAGKIS